MLYDIYDFQRLTHGNYAVNGGPPGLIFGLIVAVFYYTPIGLGLAEVCGRLAAASYNPPSGIFNVFGYLG